MAGESGNMALPIRPFRFVDVHSHHQFTGFSTLEALREAGYSSAACLSYVPVTPSGPSTLRDLFRWLVDGEAPRLREAGLRPLVGVGIHPRNLPRRGLEEALGAVEEFLPEADFLGEVGLETSSDREREVLMRQLRMADRMDRPVVLHTPRVRKAAVLGVLLRILGESPLSRERVLVDHLTPDLIPRVPEGYYVGLTVQPGKCDFADVERALSSSWADRGDRILVDSDSGRDRSDPLTLLRLAGHLLSRGYDPSEVRALVEVNPGRFVGPPRLA